MTEETPVTGKVTGAYSGSTLTLLNDSGATVKLRLAAIEPFPDDHLVGYDSRARQELTALAFDKTATIVPQYIDADGYTVGRIQVDGQDLSAEMVKRGMARVDRKQAGDTALSDLEEKAQIAKTGLWAPVQATQSPEPPKPAVPSGWLKKQTLSLTLAFASVVGAAGVTGFVYGQVYDHVASAPVSASLPAGAVQNEAAERAAPAAAPARVTLKDFDWYSLRCGEHDPTILPYPSSQHVKPRLLGDKETGYVVLEPLPTGTERTSPMVPGLSCKLEKLPEAPFYWTTVPSPDDGQTADSDVYTLACSGIEPEKLSYEASLHEKVRLTGNNKNGYTLVESDEEYGITKSPVLEAPKGAACRLSPGFTK